MSEPQEEEEEEVKEEVKDDTVKDVNLANIETSPSHILQVTPILDTDQVVGSSERRKLLLYSRSDATKEELKAVKKLPGGWSGPHWDPRSGTPFIPPLGFQADFLGEVTSKRTGVRLATQCWMPVRVVDDVGDLVDGREQSRAEDDDVVEEDPEEIKGVVFWEHGLNAWGARPAFEHKLAKFLISNGYAMVSHDHSSFGRSEGELGLRAYISKFNIFTDDAMQIIEETMKRKEFKSKPFFVAAESLGGEIAIDLCIHKLQNHEFLRNQWKGLILFAPGVLPHPSRMPSSKSVFVMRIAGLFCWSCLKTVPVLGGFKSVAMKEAAWHPIARGPGNALELDIEVNNLHSDQDFEMFYHGKMRFATAYELKRQSEKMAKSYLKHLDPPSLLIFHGAKDGVVWVEGSKLLMKHSPTIDKKLRILEDGYHNLFHDPETETSIFPEIVEFMNKRLQ